MVTLNENMTQGWSKMVKFLTDCNEVKAGEIKEVLIQKMTGRIYQPGYKTEEGRYVCHDKIGEPDNRLAVMGMFVYAQDVNGRFCGKMDNFYKVFESESELNRLLEDVDVMPDLKHNAGV